MALTVKHSKVSAVPDAANVNLVRPSDWNADHTLAGTLPVASGGTGQATEAQALGQMINALSADASPMGTTDYAVIYDASAAIGKKVLLNDLGVVGPAGPPGASGSLISITDYGAVGDGVTDNAAAFNAFTAAYQGQVVQLLMPPGSYKCSTAANGMFGGIKKLEVLGYGASFGAGASGTPLMGSNPYVSGASLSVPNEVLWASIATCAEGDFSITCTTHALASNFSAGDWIEVAGIDLQGFGDPINPYFFEFIQVESANSSTGVITLSTALRNSYLSTWPLYNAGDSGHPYLPGPATIFKMSAGWDLDITLRGLSFIDSAPGFLLVHGRKVRLVNCSFPTTQISPTPGAHQYCSIDSCDIPNLTVEFDKNVQSLSVKDCNLRRLLVQSANDKLTIENCNIGFSGLTGTAKETSIRDSYLTSLSIGPTAYGTAQVLSVDNCQIDSVAFNFPSSFQNISDFTIDAHGTLSFVSASLGPIPWAFPGAKVMSSFTTTDFYPNPFEVTGVTQSGPNTLIATTLPGVLPTFSGSGGNWTVRYGQPTKFLGHPCPSVSFTNCTGCPDVVDLSNAPKGEPAFVYTNRIYTGAQNSVVSITELPLGGRGNLKQVILNVIRAYTGSQTTLTMQLQNFWQNGSVYFDSAYTYTIWNPVVDLKTAGSRIITPGVVSGAQTNDVIPVVPAGAWFPQGVKPLYSHDISGETQDKWPIVQVLILSDQGIIGPFNASVGTGGGGSSLTLGTGVETALANNLDASGGVQSHPVDLSTDTTGQILTPINYQFGTTYTFTGSDCGSIVVFHNASAIAATLPQAVGAFSNTVCGGILVQNTGAGTVTITPTTSTIDGAATLTLATNKGAMIFSDGSNYATMRGGS